MSGKKTCANIFAVLSQLCQRRDQINIPCLHNLFVGLMDFSRFYIQLSIQLILKTISLEHDTLSSAGNYFCKVT